MQPENLNWVYGLVLLLSQAQAAGAKFCTAWQRCLMKWYTEWQETTRKIMKIMADYFHWLLLSLGSSLFPGTGLSCSEELGRTLPPLPWLSMVSGQAQTLQPGAPWAWGTRSIQRFPLLCIAPDTLTQQHWIIPEINPLSHSTLTRRRALITFYRCWATRNFFHAQNLLTKSDIQLFTDEGWDL